MLWLKHTERKNYQLQNDSHKRIYANDKQQYGVADINHWNTLLYAYTYKCTNEEVVHTASTVKNNGVRCNTREKSIKSTCACFAKCHNCYTQHTNQRCRQKPIHWTAALWTFNNVYVCVTALQQINAYHICHYSTAVVFLLSSNCTNSCYTNFRMEWMDTER